MQGLDGTKTYQALKKSLTISNGITLFGSGHLSMYMGAGAVKSRLLVPADFAGKKVRSMGPAENALGALDANQPQWLSVMCHQHFRQVLLMDC